MKLDPVVALIMVLFSLMVGATSISAFWGYTLGRQALRGVTQPEVRRTNQSNGAYEASSKTLQNHSVLRSEEEILSRVILKMNGSVDQNLITNESNTSTSDSNQTPEEKTLNDSSDSISDVAFVNYQETFPLLTEHQGVVLSVTSVEQQDNIVRVGINLQNRGDRSVEFLYSLIDVIDKQGESLSSSTDGLPQAIPPTGETFEGSISIPRILLNSSDTLSLRLTDYPNQEVELEINDIPLVP